LSQAIVRKNVWKMKREAMAQGEVNVDYKDWEPVRKTSDVSTKALRLVFHQISYKLGPFERSGVLDMGIKC
jgi:hypothetical protein